MAWITGPQLSEVTFNQYTPKSLTKSMSSRIDVLVRESLAIDFPKRSRKERKELVDEASRTRPDPNKGVGGALLQKRQAYARPISVAAFHAGEMIAYMPAADNVSSSPRRPGILGAAERGAKLHSEKLIQSRWMWLGLTVFNAQARELLEKSEPDEVSLLDIMAAVAADNFDGRQPAATYPYLDGPHGEFAWENAALGMGFSAVEGSESTKYVFGELNTPVMQHKLQIGSVATLHETIAAKQGSELLVAARQAVHDSQA